MIIILITNTDIYNTIILVSNSTDSVYELLFCV